LRKRFGSEGDSEGRSQVGAFALGEFGREKKRRVGRSRGRPKPRIAEGADAGREVG
jgi:hypothetical protein